MENKRTFRTVLACVAVVVVLAAVWAGERQAQTDEPVVFFVIGDTHILADKNDTSRVDGRSTALAAGLVDALNKLPGTEIPQPAGGGVVRPPRGVVHAGDCIETGEAAKVAMQQTEWAFFTREFGLTGKDGRLKLPIYEVHGNHDGIRDNGIPIQQIIERNKSRPGVSNISKNGLHYSWDWGNAHFVNLGIVVGKTEEVKRKRRYDPLDSLDFLISDLKEKVGSTGRPVVITHHVDTLRYSLPLPVDDKKAESLEWDPADVKAFYDALKDYNIAAIVYGHTHARNIYHWNGSTKPAKLPGAQGQARTIPVFNVAKSSHFSSKSQAFFYMEMRGNAVLVREYQTKDGWQTAFWTPQMWTTAISKE